MTVRREWSRLLAVLVVVCVVSALSACGSSKKDSASSTSDSKDASQSDQWGQWNLATDASAAGTKAYGEAVANGVAPRDAIAQALDVVKQNSDVTDSAISDNGRSVMIRYKDGGLDYILTERLGLPDSASTSTGETSTGETSANETPDTSETVPSVDDLSGFLGAIHGVRLAAPSTTSSPTPSAAPSRSCAKLPGAPAAGPPAEPGREGVHPSGGYGVALYDPSQQPKPISSADSPPLDARRALLVSGQYDVPHDVDGSMMTIRAIGGANIECLEASLANAGYTNVDTILGRVDAGKAVMTGDQAVDELTKKLKANKYGVLYFMGHGTAINPWFSANFSAISMGQIDRNRKEIKDVINGRKLDRDVNDEISKKLTEMNGLSWDKSNPPVFVGKDVNGASVLWLRPAYFEQIRSKGASFASSLVMINTCSSAANTSFVDAIKAKAFLGWNTTMQGDFINRAAETTFDSLTDKARSARAASQLWQLHELWVAKGEPAKRAANVDPLNLVALGVGGTKYEPINGQTHILIYRLRNGPSSATSDISGMVKLLDECLDKTWKSGKGGGLAYPMCRPSEFGSSVPTASDVADAEYEVGKGTMPAGRFTLAD